jgi:hypothetical protein
VVKTNLPYFGICGGFLGTAKGLNCGENTGDCITACPLTRVTCRPS